MKKLLFLLLLTSCISSQKELTIKFFRAVDNGNIKQVNRLLDKGVDVNTREIRRYHRKDRTALYYEISSRSYEMFKLLIQKGADLNFIDKEGRNFLHVAAIIEGYLDSDDGYDKDARIMNYLLANCKLDINKQDQYKNTPLHYSVYPPQYEITRLLVQHGADVNIENEAGLTPLHEVLYIYLARGYTRQMGNDAIKIVKMLMKHGACNPKRALDITIKMKRYYKKEYNAVMFKKQIYGITKMENVLRKYIKR